MSFSTALPPLSSVAERLQFARKRAKLSQRHAASAIHRSRNMIWEIETGRREPEDQFLVVFAELYEVPLSWLRMETAEPDKVEDATNAQADLPQGPADCPTCRSLLGKHLFDEAAYNKVMRAQSLAELRGLLPRSDTGFRTSVSTPIAGDCRFIDAREAEAKQYAMDSKVRQLITQELSISKAEHPDAVHPPTALFNRRMAGVVRQAIETGDRELAMRAMNWKPYFLDIVQFGELQELDSRPSKDVLEDVFELMRAFERAFPDLVLSWRERHDV